MAPSWRDDVQVVQQQRQAQQRLSVENVAEEEPAGGACRAAAGGSSVGNRVQSGEQACGRQAEITPAAAPAAASPQASPVKKRKERYRAPMICNQENG